MIPPCDNPHDHDGPDPGPPPQDELDALLREWHEQHAERAIVLREQLMARIRETSSQENPEPDPPVRIQESAAPRSVGPPPAAARRSMIRRLIMNRYSALAASITLAVVLLSQLMPQSGATAQAGQVIMVPEGGRLDALDRDGNVMGPCPLEHTDVDVAISGFISRVTLKQRFKNTQNEKIEAVYTFPLSHRAAVDRMTMTVGDRVVVGEVHERERARAIYQAAREQGYVASLLEQERPNIFTQSVANIEPGAEITVEISYVELLQSKDGQYTFDFPMVVGPRYIPGSVPTSLGDLPAGLTRRNGLVLLGPAKLELGEAGTTSGLGELQTGKLKALVHGATPISPPPAARWIAPTQPEQSETEPVTGGQPTLWYRFEAAYPNGSKESGTLHTDGTGQLNGRWFYADVQAIKDMGTGFEPNTTQVPDASRITPMPVKPDKRAGHDIALRITIDTGGPGIRDVQSVLHDIVSKGAVNRDDGLPRRVTYELMKAGEIPNRDFVLNWRQTADTVQEATFTHAGKHGKFFTLILAPPDRVTDEQAVARELIFVLDTSGSMNGFPIEKAKAVMSKAIDALRPQDTFNLITFSGDTHILWDKPRPFTQANRKEAQDFLASRQGRGGTEMMKAINAALVQDAATGKPLPLSIEQLLDLPADGRTVALRLPLNKVRYAGVTTEPVNVQDNRGSTLTIKDFARNVPAGANVAKDVVIVEGIWETQAGERRLQTRAIRFEDAPRAGPIRVVCFMTDGYVGNDMAIIDAVQKNAATTRVFSFGIGNSVNRYLLDGMARAGRGEAEYVLLESDGEEAVRRFTQRIQTPVLTDVQLSFSDGLRVTDLVPAQISDLFDVKPLVLHGRYAQAGKGQLTIRGQTGHGPYERTLDLELPETADEHDVIATLWARGRIEEIMNQDLAAAQGGAFPDAQRLEVVKLGEQFQIMTQFTSFVAVEKSRVTIGGRPVLVAVPIEMPAGVSYEGIFGPDASCDKLRERVLSEASELNVMNRLVSSPAKHRGRGDTWNLDTAMMAADEIATSFRSYCTSQAEVKDQRSGGRPAGELAGDAFFGLSASRAQASPVGQVSYGYHVSTLSSPPASYGRMPARPRSAGVARLGKLVGGGVSGSAGLYFDESSADTEDWLSLEGVGTVPGAAEDAALPDLLTALQGDLGRELARRFLLREHTALLIAGLVAEGKVDEARELAAALAALDAEYAVGVEMHRILSDEKLAPAERDRQIAKLADQVREAVGASQRKLTLQARLDEGLYGLVEGSADAAAAESLPRVGDRLLVTVLVRETDQGTIQRLRDAGLKVESTSVPARLVVGSVAADQLADMALTEGVRRIEPTRMQ